MPGDGVLEGDNQVVEGAGPTAGVVSGECESGDCLPVVEVAHKVEGEGVDLVEGAQEPLCTRRPSKSDIEVTSSGMLLSSRSWVSQLGAQERTRRERRNAGKRCRNNGSIQSL